MEQCLGRRGGDSELAGYLGGRQTVSDAQGEHLSLPGAQAREQHHRPIGRTCNVGGRRFVTVARVASTVANQGPQPAIEGGLGVVIPDAANHRDQRFEDRSLCQVGRAGFEQRPTPNPSVPGLHHLP